MRTVLRHLYCALAVLLAMPISAQQPVRGWTMYTNPRFAYTLEYPGNQLRAGREADNGDGRAFTAVLGSGKVAVWGEYASDSSTQHSEAEDLVRQCVGGQAAYRVDKPALQAMSCFTTGQAIRYFVSKRRKDVIVSLQAEYPKDEKAAWEPVIARMVKSLTLGEPAF